MNKISILASIALGAIAFSSCSSDEEVKNEQIISRNITKDITFTAVAPAVVAEGEETWTTFTGAFYLLTVDEVARTVQLAVDGLKYADGVDPVSFTTEPLPQSQENNYLLERGVDYAGPVAVMFGGKAHSLTDIRIYAMLDERRVFNGNYEHSYFISFTIDDEYVVNAIPYYNYYFGTTSTAGGRYHDYTTDNTYYKVTLDPKTRRADISLYRPKFALSMPAFAEMQFNSLPFTFGANGVDIESVSFTPLVDLGDGMYPGKNYTVTDLHGIVQFPGKSFTGSIAPGVASDSDFTLGFTVGELGTVTVDADIPMPNGFRIP
ncbi:MAG: hypothetical protein K2L62_01375 [Muribaculaceae bacterium]|nr:hypothetical protein [Muribaculaceae bacterium]